MYQPNDLPHYEIITVDCWVVLPHISVIPYLTTNAHGRTLRSNTLKRGILSTPKGEKWSYYADWDSFWLPWNSWNLPFRSVKQGLLVEDGINGNRCLTGLSIANDQFPLSTADGNQTVHCFQTSGPHSVSVADFRGEYMRFAWKKMWERAIKVWIWPKLWNLNDGEKDAEIYTGLPLLFYKIHFRTRSSTYPQTLHLSPRQWKMKCSFLPTSVLMVRYIKYWETSL